MLPIGPEVLCTTVAIGTEQGIIINLEIGNLLLMGLKKLRKTKLPNNKNPKNLENYEKQKRQKNLWPHTTIFDWLFTQKSLAKSWLVSLGINSAPVVTICKAVYVGVQLIPHCCDHS